MSELDENPNLIKYHTSFLEDDYLHILMEYANRGDLYKVSYHSMLIFFHLDSKRAKVQEKILSRKGHLGLCPPNF